MPYDPNSGTYTPPVVSGYYPVDLYNFGASPAKYDQRGVKPGRGADLVQFDQRVVDKLPEGDIIAWKMLIEDTQGGLNLTDGDFDLDFDRVSSSSLDTRFYKTLVNCQLRNSQTSPDLSSGIVGYGAHFATFNNLTHVAGGSTANSALLKETSATDATLVAVTYSPGDDITCLCTASRGNTPYLIVGRNNGSVAQALNASYATTATAMTYLRGVIQTFLDDQSWLVYYNAKIGILTTTAAINSAPTDTLTSVPDGGRALGLVKLAGGPVLAAWLWPVSSTNQMSTVGARVVTTNQAGTDYQVIPMGVPVLKSATIVNDSAIVGISFDGSRILYYDGRTQARDLRWNSAREANSDRYLVAVDIACNGNELIVEVNSFPQTGATAGTYVQRWWESYNLETNAWHRISVPVTLASGSTGSYPFNTGLPISPSTRNTHIYLNNTAGDDGWHRIYLPVYGQNPYNTLRQTDGAGTSTGNEYELTGTYTSPYWNLPDLQGHPFIVSRIHCLGDIDAGGTSGTDATVVVTAGNLTHTFATGFGRRPQLVDFADSGEVQYQLQVAVTQTRNSGSTRWTGNALPIMIEGYSFVSRPDPPYGWVSDGR